MVVDLVMRPVGGGGRGAHLSAGQSSWKAVVIGRQVPSEANVMLTKLSETDFLSS